MLALMFDPEDPPLDAPTAVPQPLLWVVARQLFGDHDVPADRDDPMVPLCGICGETWPCRPRRLAEHGLLAACRSPSEAGGPASYVDRFLTQEPGSG